MTAYRSIAPYYDRLFERFNVGLRRVASRLASPRPGSEVLDLGCGTGAWLAELAAVGCRVTGVDPSAAMLAQARQRLGDGADLYQGSAAALPFRDHSFDLVTSSLVLHELPRATREQIAGEARRVVRPNGRIVIVDFHPRPWRVGGWLRRPALAAVEMAAGWEHYKNHRDFLRSGGVPGLAESAELLVDELRPIAGGVLAAVVLRRPD